VEGLRAEISDLQVRVSDLSQALDDALQGVEGAHRYLYLLGSLYVLLALFFVLFWMTRRDSSKRLPW
jgi:flagellar biogenesis protein FliO